MEKQIHSELPIEQPVTHELPETIFVDFSAPPIDPKDAECLDTRALKVRQDLSDIPSISPDLLDPIIITSEPVTTNPEPTPIETLREKRMKKTIKERKESAPRQYSEMLVVANDFQFLRNADDEAVGAFMQYVDANKKKITHLVLNGDIADMEQANKFGSTPDQAGTMANEIAAMQWFISKMTDQLPDAKRVFIFGNHDHRFGNYMANKTDGIEEWVKSPEEMWGLSDWEVIPYGQGKYYKWHDRVFWHGQRAGAKAHIAKLEVQDAGVSVTTAHINRNQYHEERTALGELKTGIVHGGFSRDNLHFVKKANSNWSQGFGVYFWDKKVGEQPYSVVLKHGTPAFIGPDGVVYSGENYNLRQEIGLDPVSNRRRRR